MFDLYGNICELAKKHGYTPTGLCVAMGMSRSTLSNLKNGRIETLSQGVLKRIAEFLDEPFDRVAHGAAGENKPIPQEEDGLDRMKMKLIDSIRDMSDEQVKALQAIVDQLKAK